MALKDGGADIGAFGKTFGRLGLGKLKIRSDDSLE